MSNIINAQKDERTGFLQDYRAVLQLLTYTLVLIGACSSVFYFIFRENTETQYKAQLAISDATQIQLNTTINQMQSRITYLENENQRLHSENNKYLSWLRDTPGTFENIIKENEALFEENIKLLADNEDILASQMREGDLPLVDSTVELYYSKSYTNIRTNIAVKDEGTGIIIASNNIYISSGIDINYTILGDQTRSRSNIKAGEVLNIEIGEVKYQLIIDEYDYVTSTYGFTIRQIPNIDNKE